MERLGGSPKILTARMDAMATDLEPVAAGPRELRMQLWAEYPVAAVAMVPRDYAWWSGKKMRYAMIIDNRVHQIFEHGAPPPAEGAEIVQLPDDRPEIAEQWERADGPGGFRPPRPSKGHEWRDGQWAESDEMKTQMEAAKQAREEVESLLRATGLTVEERLDRVERVLSERLGVHMGSFHPDNS